MRLLRRGDIWLIDFAPVRAGAANYVRPGIVVTNNLANAHAHVVLVVPLTSSIERVFVSELLLPLHRTDLEKDSKAQVQLVRHVSVSRFQKRIGYAPEDLMYELDVKLMEWMSLPPDGWHP